MIIDPDTGYPAMDPPRMAYRAASSGSEALGMSAEENPFLFQILENIPGLTTLTAWNMGRVSSTVATGDLIHRSKNSKLPWRRGMYQSSRAGQGGWLAQGPLQTFGPRHFNRLTSAGNIDPLDVKGNKTYTPFHFLSKIGNGLARRGMLGPQAKSFTEDGGAAFSKGTLGRIAGSARVGSMSDSAFARNQAGIFNSLERLANGRYSEQRLAQMAAGGTGSGAGSARFSAKVGIGMTVSGGYSGRLIGYIHGAEAARAGISARDFMGEMRANNRDMLAQRAQGGLNNKGNAYRTGAKSGYSAYARNTMMGRVVGSGAVSAGMRAVPVVGKVLLARDIAMLAGTVTAAHTKMVVDAGRELVRPLNKGVMGQRYVDNSVAATSRQRGVMAISNSRLNARSALGSEAAAMHAYY